MKISLPLVISILLCCSSCSRKSEKDLFSEAQDAYDQKQFQESISKYQEIVDRSPGSAYADSSLMRIAAVYSNDIHDNRKALAAYQQYCRIFPMSSQAPTALFLEAFIYNNELHQLDSARMLYEKFLQQYPNHELAKSAKFELESLGKDPTQLIKPQSADNQTESSAPHK